MRATVHRRFIIVAIASVHLAGCNDLLGLRPTTLVDAAPGGPRDGLLLAPDGTTSCEPRPSFEAWQYAPYDLVLDQPGEVANALALYGTGSQLRAIVASTSGDALFETGLDGTATRLASLDPPSASSVSRPRISPDGAVLWYVQTGAVPGVFFATRASGWTKERALLGFVDAEQIEPGTPGFFAGTVRMVVAVSELGQDAVLREIVSADGVSWSPLETIKFQIGSFGARHASLSPDGCYLLFTASTSTTGIYVVAREPDGTFTSPVKLDAPSMLASGASSPVVAPDETSLWFFNVVGGETQLFRGQP